MGTILRPPVFLIPLSGTTTRQALLGPSMRCASTTSTVSCHPNTQTSPVKYLSNGRRFTITINYYINNLYKDFTLF